MLHVALLRGINVGGNCKLPMKELAVLFADSGASDVRTYIQSGNVVFAASQPEKVTEKVTEAIALRYKYPGRIVLRSAAEMRATLTYNPFLQAGTPESALHVYFLADLPEASAVKQLDPMRSPSDAFAVRGRDVYLHLPNGMARTKLSNAYFDTHLKTVSTARNWNTVTKLVQMMELEPS
jgi:uncharacterized protein (DUF1697 family)